MKTELRKRKKERLTHSGVLYSDRAGEELFWKPHPACPGQENGICVTAYITVCLNHEYRPGSLQKLTTKQKHRRYMGGAELLLQRKRVVETKKAEAFH